MLEERLGVRLIQRSTRSFTVTELGQAYYTRCRAMLVEADAAQDLIAATQSEPCGLVRIACPIDLLHAHVGRMLVSFAPAHPSVKVQLVGVNRAVDLVAEGWTWLSGCDHRPWRTAISPCGCWVMRPSVWWQARPLSRHSACPGPRRSAVMAEPRSWRQPEGHHWTLLGPDGARVRQHHSPRFATTDMQTLRQGGDRRARGRATAHHDDG